MYARYSRNEILYAFRKSTPERAFPSQEGLIDIPALNTELLLITLNKSEKDFSPSTQYEDYAINEKLIHWQSQNKTAPESPVGIAYSRHRQINKKPAALCAGRKVRHLHLYQPLLFLRPGSICFA